MGIDPTTFNAESRNTTAAPFGNHSCSWFLIIYLSWFFPSLVASTLVTVVCQISWSRLPIMKSRPPGDGTWLHFGRSRAAADCCHQTTSSSSSFDQPRRTCTEEVRVRFVVVSFHPFTCMAAVNKLRYVVKQRKFKFSSILDFKRPPCWHVLDPEFDSRHGPVQLLKNHI